MSDRPLNVCVQADCREFLATLPEASIDAVVTDPPYELAFMGKKWDGTGIAYSVPLWREALRVLKPGGHLLAFGGTRTHHRMVCAIEDAGFEIRDEIQWLYGSGFPKSLDVSKAIDKCDAADERRARQLRFTGWMRSAWPFTAGRANEIMGTDSMAGHYFTDREQPAIATREYFDKLRPHFTCEVPAWVEQLVNERTVESENFKRREVVGQRHGKNHADGRKSCFNVGEEFVQVEIPITAPATAEAKQWQGWGTALKPACEPICVARKPLIGTVAANVLAHGTGALNIDGGRVGFRGGDGQWTSTPGKGKIGQPEKGTTGVYGHYRASAAPKDNIRYDSTGRWPANVLHDGSEEVLAAFALFGESKGAFSPVKRGHSGSSNGIYSDFAQKGDDGATFRGDTGTAARFFYCAKASRRERDEGCDALAEKVTSRYGEQGQGPSEQQTPRTAQAQRNHHPTVKPLALMRYLVRLVTPPGGVVLDPFAGSGTTLLAAKREGFHWLGSELEPDHLVIIAARLGVAVPQLTLFPAGCPLPPVP